MPVTRSRTYLTDIGLEDSNNTTGFLFGDEDSNSAETRTTPTAQVGNTDPFPSLFRQQAYSSMVSLASPSFCLAAARRSVWWAARSFAFAFPSLSPKFPVSAIWLVSENSDLHQVSVLANGHCSSTLVPSLSQLWGKSRPHALAQNIFTRIIHPPSTPSPTFTTCLLAPVFRTDFGFLLSHQNSLLYTFIFLPEFLMSPVQRIT
jgi:hypothetical protein